MNRDKADEIVRAVLYEGYNLYPYRPSVKNRHRWTFGGLFPASYGGVRDGSDAANFEMQCLVRGDETTRIAVRVLFLHLRERRIGRLPQPVDELPGDSQRCCEYVESLEVDGQLYQPWQEAVEREVDVAERAIGELSGGAHDHFQFTGGLEIEPICDRSGAIVALIAREQKGVEGHAVLAAQRVASDVYRLTLRVGNDSPLEHTAIDDRERALLSSLASTNAVLCVEGGEFLSMTDPPADCEAMAAACRNRGVWPVLVGESGDKDMLLASPIILYDYPHIAPESPGDLYDGTEIDEILTLRIMTMTEEEKRSARAVDDRTRRLMQRTEALAREQLAGLHGSVRSFVASSAPDAGLDLDGFSRQESVHIGDSEVHVGDRVRLRPKAGGDVFDLALRDHIATVESIEQDFEDRIYLAVTVDDDPGQDFGRAKQPGHRFFFKPEEVEPLKHAGDCPDFCVSKNGTVPFVTRAVHP
jgi:hypothetical protein